MRHASETSEVSVSFIWSNPQVKAIKFLSQHWLDVPKTNPVLVSFARPHALHLPSSAGPPAPDVRYEPGGHGSDACGQIRSSSKAK